jgi:hypothetical protein
MVKRYAHVTARLRRDIADRLNTYFWSANETTNETGSDLWHPDAGVSQASCLLRTGGQGQGRTADLPLFRCILTVAGCRWASPDKPSDLHDCRGTSPDVAGRLAPLAPSLAPRLAPRIGRRRVPSGESVQGHRG